jgi:hypothetical protein
MGTSLFHMCTMHNGPILLQELSRTYFYSITLRGVPIHWCWKNYAFLPLNGLDIYFLNG